jgi:hypothetical protein
MIGTLHNSHSGFMTDEEYRLTKHVLPLFFNLLSGRVFVSYVFQAHQPGVSIPLEFGDEILSVDGKSPTALKPASVFWVEPVVSNPYHGTANSTAKVTIRRGSAVLDTKVPRVRRFADVDPLVYHKIGDHIAYIRFLKMDKATISMETLRFNGDVEISSARRFGIGGADH